MCEGLVAGCILIFFHADSVFYRKSDCEPQSRVGKALDVQVYQYKPSLQSDAQSADLIISHAGAGSVLEALRAVS